MKKYKLAVVLCVVASVGGQTLTDVRPQTKNADFSEAVSATRAKTGAVLPGTCKEGEMFLIMAEPPGHNLYTCVSGNVWKRLLVLGGDSGRLAAGPATPNPCEKQRQGSDARVLCEQLLTDAFSSSDVFVGTGSVVPVSGDCTLSNTGVIACTKTVGVVFAASATTDTTNAGNIVSGTLPAGRLPNPSATSLGGVQSALPVPHQWISAIASSGVPQLSQPDASDLTGLAPSATTDTTNAGNIGTGILPAGRLPKPATTTLGGVQAVAPIVHQWINSIATTGVPQLSQPAAADLTGLAPSATIDATDASNIGSGILPAGRLPNPTAATLGGVQAVAPVLHQWVNSVSTTGVPQLTQPAAADVSGLSPSATTDTTNAANIVSGILPAARLPNPTATTLGGVQAVSPVSHQWVNSVSTTGVPQLSQPAAADITGLALSATTDTTNAANIISGILPAAQLPIATGSTPGAVKPDGTSVSIASDGRLSATNLFSSLASGTNTSSFTIGSGGSLSFAGSGTINASSLNGVAVGNAATAGASLVATSGGSAVWQVNAPVYNQIIQHNGTAVPQRVLENILDSGSGNHAISVTFSDDGSATTGIAFDLVTGPTGALDCVTNAYCDVVTALVPLKSSANNWTGTNNFQGASALEIPSGSGPPSAACSAVNVNAIYGRSDAFSGSGLYMCQQTAVGVYSWVLPGGNGITAPAITVVGNVPQYGNTAGNSLTGGLGVVTSIGAAGSDTNIPTEKSVRSAISAANAFSNLTGGVNTSAAMIVGSGASLAASGSGTIAATSVPASGVSGLAASATTDTTNAGNITSGTLPAARLPNPTASSLGGVQSIAAISRRWINSISTLGVPVLSQPAAADISGLAASATTDTTNASNISSGTLPAARLPNPSPAALGGVQSVAAVTHKFVTSISTLGIPALAQPVAADVSGLAASATTDTTNASNIASGTLAAALLPIVPVAKGGTGTATPSLVAGTNISVTGSWPNQTVSATASIPAIASTTNLLAGDGAGNAVSSGIVANQVVTLNGAQTLTNKSLSASQVSGLAPSAVTDTTNAANISSGTLPASRLPNPTALTLGGIQSLAVAARQWVNGVSTSGVPSTAQPTVADIGGAANTAWSPSTAYFSNQQVNYSGQILQRIGTGTSSSSFTAAEAANWNFVGNSAILPFVPSVFYYANAITQYGNVIFQRAAAGVSQTAFPLDSANWTPLTNFSTAEYVNFKSAAPSWTPANVYAAGTQVQYFGQLLRASSSFTSGATFNAAEAANWVFTAVTVPQTWASGIYYYQGAEITSGTAVYTHNIAAISGTATFAGEASNWTVLNIYALSMWNPNTVYPANAVATLNGQLLLRSASGTTGATFNSAEAANWIYLTTTSPMPWMPSSYYYQTAVALANGALFTRSASGVSGNANFAQDSSDWSVAGTGWVDMRGSTALGINSLPASVSLGAAGNTVIGYHALQGNTTGGDNLALGSNAGLPSGVIYQLPGTTAAGSATVAMANTAGLAPGQLVWTLTGSIPAAATILSVSANAGITLSVNATAGGTTVIYASSNAQLSGNNNSFVGSNSGFSSAAQQNYLTVLGSGATCAQSNALCLGRKDADTANIQGILAGTSSAPAATVAGSGCSLGGVSGNNLVGMIAVTGTAASCSVTLTFTVAAPNHQFCGPLQNRTSGALAAQAADTATSATFNPLALTSGQTLQYGVCAGN